MSDEQRMTAEQEAFVEDIRPGHPEYPRYAAKFAPWVRTVEDQVADRERFELSFPRDRF